MNECNLEILYNGRVLPSLLKNKGKEDKGIRTHCRVTAFFLNLFSKLGICSNVVKYNDHYLNEGSLKKWAKEKKIEELNSILNASRIKLDKEYVSDIFRLVISRERPSSKGSSAGIAVARTSSAGITASKRSKFVDVINKREYTVNGEKKSFAKASKPKLVQRDESKTFSENIKKLLESYPDIQAKNSQAKNSTNVEVVDLSTEQAVVMSNSYAKIALNFANEEHAGGNPGIYKDDESGQLVYHTQSARAQEESLCQRSDLMASLTQLKHEVIRRAGTVWSYYKFRFSSTTMAYTSDNHLFAVQGNDNNFYNSRYVDPCPVSFVTSAAEKYRGKIVSCDKGSKVYTDARKRIETHLLAALSKALENKKDKDKESELILGAFGCGQFAPTNAEEYREMIAGIYKDLLPECKEYFGKITFAVPTFNREKGSEVENYNAFNKVFSRNNGDITESCGS